MTKAENFNYDVPLQELSIENDHVVYWELIVAYQDSFLQLTQLFLLVRSQVGSIWK